MIQDVSAVSVMYHGRKVGTLSVAGRGTCQFEYDNTLGEHATTVNFHGLPSDEDMITVGTNAHLKPQRCREVIEEVREETKELQQYF